MVKPDHVLYYCGKRDRCKSYRTRFNTTEKIIKYCTARREEEVEKLEKGCKNFVGTGEKKNG